MLTEKDCRRRAVYFYIKTPCDSDQSWIDEGDDAAYIALQPSFRRAFISDVIECAKLLWSAIQDDRKARAS